METRSLTRLTNPPIQEPEPKSQSPEPEVEECCEDNNQIKQMLENLGLDYDHVLALKSVSHISPSGACIHCKLTEKVKNLTEKIGHLTGEIETTEKILNVKKKQNKDIKGIIEKLESIGNSDGSIELNEGKNCSCKGCLIF